MSDIEFRAVERLAGSSIAYAYAVKAGSWLFLTGHEAFDFEQGLTPEIEGPAGFPSFGKPPMHREADYIVHRIRRILESFGAGLANSVRVDQYYPTPEAVFAYQQTRHAEFGNYIPPSTSVLMERCLSTTSNISTSLIAAVPDAESTIERIYPKEVPLPLGSGFVPAVVCKEFVFVAGQMAAGEAAIDPSVMIPPRRNWGGASPIRRQAEFVIRKRLEPALVAAGSSLANAVKAQIYVDQAKHVPDVLDVWAKCFGDTPCAITIVPTKGYAEVDGLIEINLLALRDGARRKKEVIAADIPPMAAYGPTVRAGEFVFPSGMMAIEPSGRIAGVGQSSAFDSLSLGAHHQAEVVLGYAEAIAAAAGTTAQNIVRAQYFMADIREFPGVAMAWTQRYGRHPHPFVAVQVPAPLPAPGAALTADFWIYAP